MKHCNLRALKVADLSAQPVPTTDYFFHGLLHTSYWLRQVTQGDRLLSNVAGQEPTHTGIVDGFEGSGAGTFS